MTDKKDWALQELERVKKAYEQYNHGLYDLLFLCEREAAPVYVPPSPENPLTSHEAKPLPRSQWLYDNRTYGGI